MEAKNWIIGDEIKCVLSLEAFGLRAGFYLFDGFYDCDPGKVIVKSIPGVWWLADRFEFVRRPLANPIVESKPEPRICGSCGSSNFQAGEYCGCTPETSAPVVKESSKAEPARYEVAHKMTLHLIGQHSILLSCHIRDLVPVSKSEAIQRIDSEIEKLQNLKRELQPKRKAWSPKYEGVVIGRY